MSRITSTAPTTISNSAQIAKGCSGPEPIKKKWRGKSRPSFNNIPDNNNMLKKGAYLSSTQILHHLSLS